MSVTCNNAVLSPDTPIPVAEHRLNVAKKAGATVQGAIADLLLALEQFENDRPTHAVAVYFGSVVDKLETASAAYQEMRDILAEHPTAGEVLAWRSGLDFAAVYKAGIEGRYMPHGVEAWSRIVDLCGSADSPVFAPIDAVRADIADMLLEARDLRTMAEGEMGRRDLSAETVRLALSLEARMADFLVFFRMLVYLNNNVPVLAAAAVDS